MQTSAIQGFRLSPQQEHLWRALGEGHSPGLVVQGALELAGAADPDRLRRALLAAVERHEILRTTFDHLPGMTLPVQVIREDAPPEIERRRVDPAPDEGPEEAFESLAAEARALPFDLARGPLVRAWLVEGLPGAPRLLLTLPALVADAPSLARLAAEVAAGSTGTAETGGEPLQYADAAEILHHWLDSPEDEPGIAYWRRQDLSALSRTDGAETGNGFAPRQVRRPLRRERSARIEALAGRLETPVPLLLLAAWHAAIWRSTGEDEGVVGVAFDGRTCDEFVDALGPFSRRLPVRARLDAATTLPELVRSLSATVADAARRQDFFSAAKLSGWPWAFDAGMAPPFALPAPAPALPFRMLAAGGDRCGVRLSVHGEGGELALELHFDPLQNDGREAGLLLERLLALVEGAAADPGRPLADIDVLTADERRELLAAASGPAAEAGPPAHERFAEQARQTPGAPALVALDGEALLTYAELADRATRLARHLHALGVGPGERVGLCAERRPDDPSLLAGLLAVLAAGGAYVPLDPSHPAERLGYQMEDSGISVLLSTAGPLAKLPVPAGVRVVRLDADVPDAGGTLPRTGPDDLAYVLYTSGSTGRPKGVMVPHRGLSNYLAWAREAYRAGEGRGTPVHSPLGFDLTVTSLLVPLVSGSPVCLLPEGPGLGELATALRAGRDLTLVKLTPAHLEALCHVLPAAEAAGAARALVIGGEALWAESLAFWRGNAPGTRLINEYGPTEATVGCCVHEVEAGDPATGPVPIGLPIANTRLYLAGPGLQPVPGGVAGELWIGGDGLARGYLGRPDLTAERFVPDPFGGEPGSRLYRTGDLARRRRDGRLEFLGRIDGQVKIRGFRIEPGEIEAVLAGHPAVREAAVIARGEPGGKRLAAYFVARGPVSPGELRAFLAGRLPEHMVPSTFTPLSGLPLTPNGKLDRKALPEPATDGETAGYAAPRTLFEELLAEIWAGALEAPRVGIDDPFFSLGGDSILAIKVVSLAQKRGVPMVLQDLFQHPTVRALAGALGQRSGMAGAVPAGGPLSLLDAGDLALLPAGIEDAYPLTQVQAGMLFHSERDPEGAVYHVQHSFRLRIRFDAGLLQRAVDRVIARHPVLRTSFDLAAFGEPLQLVHQAAEAPVGIDDLRSLDSEEQRRAVLAWLAENRHRPFDWRRPPLVRFHVHLLEDEEIQLTLSLHHAVLDGWSAAALLAELFRHYMSLLEGVTPPEEPPITASFRELVHWERALLASPRAAEAWDRRLAGWELTRVPRLGGGRPGAAGAEVLVSHPEPAISDGLHRFARAASVPLKSVLLAAHFRVLALLSGRSDVLTGLVGHGRPEREDGERVLGMFLNTLPMRLSLPGGTWAELAQAAFDLERDLLPFRAFPVPELQRRQGGQPLFETVFNFLHYHVYRSVAGIPGAEVLEVTDYEEINYPFMATFFLSPADGQVQFLLNYHPAEFGRDEIARAARRYAAVLAALVADPAGRYDETPLLSAAEQRQILSDWNDTRADFGPPGWVPGLIAAQAARTPAAVAVVCEGRSLTYGELDAAANRLARRLCRLGVGPETLAGVAMERSPELVVALLGILAAGAAYVPLDPSYPHERLLYMLEDSGVSVLLTQRHLAERFPAGPARRLCLDDPALGLEAERSEPPAVEIDGAGAAYMIYTSGSTGRPKGAVNTHAGLRNRLLWMQEAYGLTPEDRVLQKTPFSFDVSVWEFFWPLLTGARLVLARPGGHQDPLYLARRIAAEGITTLHFVPSMLQVFLEEEESARCTGLRRVICSGEALPPALAERFFAHLPGVELHNLYGPTEAAVDVTAWACEPGAAGVPIGRPVANTRIHLLDELGQPVPAGTPGELHIGGIQLARGYHGRPGLTAERFVPDPLAARNGEPGARLYRTGDRARYRPDGALEYLGRIDFQVKIRGVRIELGEIEAVLASHPGVREAAVLAREEEGGNRLAAYVVPRGEVAAADLRAFLGERLPDAMVPATFTLLQALPLTPSGKLDRRALPAPEAPAGQAPEPAAPRHPLEEVVAGIWADVLGRPGVGRDDDFVELGGHSLLATRVVSRLRQALRVELPLRALFETRTVARLAAWIEGELRAGAGLAAPPIERAPRSGALPLSFAQQRLWFLDQMVGGSPLYNIPTNLRVSGPVQPGVLAASLDEIVRRHEALRTTFATRNGEPVQVVAPRLEILLPLIDLGGLPAEAREAESLRLLKEEARLPFDLARGPLLRARLVRLGAADHLLLSSLHHIVADGWSTGVLVRELAELYAAFSAGLPSPLPELAIQYPDFALWQRQWLRGEVLERQLSYWRRKLESPPQLDLPTDRPRPAIGSFRGAAVDGRIPAPLASGIDAFSRRRGATPFTVLLAAFAALLHRYTGQLDLLVGVPIANRNRAETEGLIGFFVNTLALRVQLSRDLPGSGLVERVRESVLEAYTHQDLPFEKLVEELQPDRDTSRNPLFQVVLLLQNFPTPDVDLPELTLRSVPVDGGTAKFDLQLFLAEVEDGLAILAEHSTDLFDAPTIVRLLEHYRALLAGLAGDPGLPLSDLPLLGEGERQQLLAEWNDTRRDDPEPLGLPQLLAARARRAPQAVAVTFEDRHLTYAELDARAERLARRLAALGAGPETRVGIALERSLELMIALLATWKAGAAYVPLDPDYPRERLAFMLDDARPAVLLTQTHLLDALPAAAAPTLCLDADPDEGAAEAPLPAWVDDMQLAYVIYTSGSTGRPKGAMLHHRGLRNRLRWMQEAYGLTPADTVLQKTPTSFDVSVWELFWPLMTGARLVLAKPGGHRDPTYLAGLIAREGVTVLHFVPSMLQAFLDQPDLSGCGSLRLVVASGEALPPALEQRFGERLDARLENLYGPTEASVDVTAWSCRGELRSVPIGRPIANTRIHLLDAERKPVPVGVAGELWIGGVNVGRGYLDRPGLTAERFGPDPFAAEPGERLYRTGDLARYLPNGAIEFLGRLDHQVKIRGFRIELGEIETVLASHPAVRECAAVVREEGSGDRRIVAYVVEERDRAEAAGEEAREQIEQWRHLYDDTYSQGSPEDDPTLNLVGWNSSYTGSPIPREEMREWIDAAVERILALKPRRVLEIGCGTGLLLFRVAPGCERYAGTDFSAAALRYVERHLAGRDLAGVELHERPADDFSGFEPASFDLVVLNSVVQYFPSVEYLLAVLAGAARVVAPGGAIFVGDVRSLPLLDAFAASVELAHAPAGLGAAELCERALRRVLEEEELVLDPALFLALPGRIAGLAAARIELKRGRRDNELTRFRYDVVLRAGEPAGDEGAGGDGEHDWQRERLSLSALRALLAGGPESLTVARVPNARTGREAQLAARLAAAGPALTAADLRRETAEAAASEVEPEDLWDLGRELGYSTHVAWDGSGEGGRMRVSFERRGTGGWSARTQGPERPWTAFANDPLAGRFARKLVPQLSALAAERLPEHAVPAAFVLLTALPLTPSGKLDRRALPAPGREKRDERSYLAPRGPHEELVASIWEEILGLEKVGVRESFFDLGGHSLLATQVVSRIRRALHVEIPVRQMFERPTVEGLALAVAEASATLRGPGLPPLAPRRRAGDPPLSFAQQRLWFLQQLEPDNAAYNMPFALRLGGPLDVGALAGSLSAIAARHETLRTTFPSRGGEPVQSIAPPAPLPLPWVDLSALPETAREPEAERLARAEAARPFDLARPPVVRQLLVRLDAAGHVLVFTVHHVSADEWSSGVWTRELIELYEAATEGREARLPALPVQYADFAAWQRGWMQGEVLDAQIAYWREQLAGAPAFLDLPTDRPRPPVQTFRGRRQTLEIPAEAGRAVRALGRREGVTPFMLLLAAFQALLNRVSGQDTVVVGTPIANRNHAEIEGLIGFFVNTLALRADFGDDPGFLTALHRVREAALGAYAHQDLPFERLVDALHPERDMSRAPIFQAMFVFQAEPVRPLRLRDLDVRPFGAASGVARFELTLACAERPGGGLSCVLDSSCDLFEEETTGRLLRLFAHLLAAATAHPETAVSALPLLDDAETREVLARGRGPLRERPELLLHQIFREQAARTPEAPAVVSESRRLTYGELDRLAGEIAAALARRGTGPESVVAVALERSPEALAALLGVLYAGGAYLPLDVEAPRERLAAVVADAGASLLLTREGLAPALAGVAPQLLKVDRDLGGPAASPSRLPLPEPGHPAYVIYTSGSTGTAKGVVVPHRAAVNFTLGLAEALELGPGDALLLFAPLSFDASVLQIFPALARGAAVAVHPNPRELAGGDLLGFCARLGVTVLDLPAAVWRQWVEAAAAQSLPLPACLRAFLTGGESVPVARLRTWAGLAGRPLSFLSSYGPTEATVTSTTFRTASDRIPEAGWSHVPIGVPLPNTRACVLDRWMRPVPPGVRGELFLAGTGLARGYLGRPDLTAASFLPDPGSGEPGGRLYRTGDLARWLTDGNLEFLGRADHQVKIRGFRVELAEIEAELVRHPAVREAAVVLREDRPGDKRLVAYLVAGEGRPLPAVSELRSFLAERLPQYMLPAAFLPMDSLPVLGSGKVDRAALPAPEADRPDTGSAYVAPQSVEEEILAGVWAQVLGLERVGIHDNFFALGGDSILSIQIVSRAARAGLRITPRQLFERQTVAALAEVSGLAAAGGEQGPVTGPAPLLPIQHWFFAEGFAAPHHFNQALALAAREPLDDAALARAVAAVHAHHDALRLRFSRGPEGWSQEHAAETEPAFTCVDLSALPAARQAAARAQAAAEVQEGFDLARGPLARLVHFSPGAGAGRLVWAIHHLVVDGVSWRVLLEDLETAYARTSRGLPPVLPPKTTSYKTWAERLAAHARSGALAAELDHWRAAASAAVPRLPVDFPAGLAANTLASEEAVSVELSREETQALLQKVPALYRTQVNDALLSALAQALAPWTGPGPQRIDLEGHGREELFPDVDLSRTVGWFTTQFPVVVDVSAAADPGAALIAVKEQLRAVPGRGLGYGLLRYLEGAESEAVRALLESAPRSEISFNYLGQLNAPAGETPVFAPASDSTGPLRSPGSHRTHLLDVSGLVADGHLQLTLRFSARVHRRSTVERIAAAFAQALRDLASRSAGAAEPVASASDFPMARLDEKTFHKLLAQLGEADSFGAS